MPTGVAAQTLPAATNLRERHAKLRVRWVHQAEQAADQLQAKGQLSDALAIRSRIEPRATELISIPLVDTRSESPVPGSAGRRSTWPRELDRARKKYAKDLFDLAASAYRVGEISTCYELLCDVVEHDPDHGPARSLLGYTRLGDQWVTPYTAAKLKSGQIWDPRFGWVPKTQRARLEAGEQLWKNEWLPAEQVARYRSEWANAWEIETEHYLIRTNVSLERGVAFAEKLEKLYQVFFRLFAGFFTPREQLAALFEGRGRRDGVARLSDAMKNHRRFRVNFYASAEQYTEAVRGHVRGSVEGTTGIYVPGTRTAYFFANQEMDEATVIHEATHQLFSESREHRQGIGSEGNHWVIEGIACYMESFRDRGNHIELGSWETPRLEIGRARIVEQQTYVPLDRLVRMGIDDFRGPSIYALYSESACVCRFLMHYDDGVYRDPLVKYLEAVYTGRATYATLSELTGVDFSALDRQCRAHIEAGEN